MDKLVSVFKKVARLLTIILLLVLAALELVALINALRAGGSFMGIVASLTIHLLLTLLYGAPAILLLVKKDREALITLSFLIGYLFISAVVTLLNRGQLIAQNVPALTIIYAIVNFMLGLAYAFVLICFLLQKVFGLKLMKIGFIVLVFSLVLIFIIFILEIVMAIQNNMTFAGYISEFTSVIVIPLVMVFGLMVLDEDSK